MLLEKIFDFTIKELNLQLIKYKDETEYSNNLEKLNAVIIHNFNNNKLNEQESKIVESDNYDNTMNLNPENYNEFIEFYNKLNKKIILKNSKININIKKELLKSWRTPKLITTLGDDIEWVNSIAISNVEKAIDNFGNNISEQYIISGSADKTIKVWKINYNEKLSNFEFIKKLEGHTNHVTCVAISDKYIISGSIDKTIKIWEISNDFKCIETLENNNSVSSVAIKNQYIVSGLDDFTIKVWTIIKENNNTHFELLEILKGHTNYVSSLEISNINIINNNDNIINTQYIVSGSYDNTIKVWFIINYKNENLTTNKNYLITCIKTLKGNNNWFHSISMNDNYLVSGSNDSTIKIWKIINTHNKKDSINYPSFQLVEISKNHIGSVNSVAISKNTDNIIVSGSNDNTVKIWKQSKDNFSLLEFECITTINEPEPLICVAIGNIGDKQYIISCLAETNKIKVWEKN